MSVIGIVIGVAVAAGAVAYAAARRWPDPIQAPRLVQPTITEEVERSPRLAELLRRRTDPTTLTGLALTAAGALVIGGAIGIGALLTMVRTHQGFARWDVAFAQFGADHASSASTSFLRDVSQLAGYQGVVVIGLLLIAVEWRRHRSLALIGFVVLALGGQFAIAELVKAVVGRGRPDILHLTGFSGSSFPSGHATAAAAMFMAAALLLGRKRSARTKAVLVGLAVGLAVAVASTRVLLGVHWFTDVLAGLLLGWAWFALCSIAFGGRIMQFGAPVEQAETIAVAVADEPAAPVEAGEGSVASGNGVTRPG
jgi:undecaprenyl-diphosphatase